MEKLDRYKKYIHQYRYLANIGDRRMGKARIEANKPIIKNQDQKKETTREKSGN